MPTQGFTRLRKHQFGRQALFGTPVAATRAYPFSGVPSVNPTWTDPDVDVGSIATVVAPYRGAGDYTFPMTIPLVNYNDLPLLHDASLGFEVEPTGGGTAKTWTHSPSVVAPVTQSSRITYEFGDDVLTDWFQLSDGVLESLEFQGPSGGGPVTGSGTWRFGSARSTGSTDFPVVGTVPTPGLEVDQNAACLYVKDLSIYISDSLAAIAANQIRRALHSFTLSFAMTYDLKRWADGTQSFDAEDIVKTGITVTFTAVFGKTADTVGTGSESDDWFAATAVERYIRLRFESLVEAQSGIPYSQQYTFPARYYTRTDGEDGGNSTVALEAHANMSPDDANLFFQSITVCTLTNAELGDAGS